MSNGHRWSKFWWQDWQNDAQLKLCGHLAKGVWIDLLCLMAQAEPVGHLVLDGHSPSIEEISTLIGMPIKQLASVMDTLERRKIFSRTEDGVIYSRRMVRDAAASEAGREHVSKRWNGEDKHPPPNRGANSQTSPTPNRGPNRPKAQQPNSPPTSSPNTLEAEAEAEAEAEREGSAHALPARAREATPNRFELLPEGWKPQTKSTLVASNLGFNEQRHWAEANRFAAWATDKKVTSRDWENRFCQWLTEAANRDRQRTQPEAKSVHQQIREAGNLPTFFGPTPSDDNQGVRLTAIAGGKS